MRHTFSIYLRTYRKKFGLSQREAAILVGMETGQNVSRHERRSRVPSLKTAIAYSTVFEMPLRALFPELYREVEEIVLERAVALRAVLLAEKPTQRSAHKVRCLEEMIRSIEAPDEV